MADITDQEGSWDKKNVLSIHQFNKATLMELMQVATKMKSSVKAKETLDLLHGKVLANVFYEPSTRTSCSFQAAMLRLGGTVICVDEVSSSVKKGETLSDTIRCLGCYTDVIVLRHPVQGSANIAADVSSIPIINAGDGIGEHPTQALLDIYTILEEIGHLDDIVVTMVGDLKNGRTVHSLARILSLFRVKLNYVSPESLKMPRKLYEDLNALGIEQNETSDLSSVFSTSDVLYVTRIQKERFSSEAEYEAVKNSFVITKQTMSMAKESAVLMHPLPRVGEIAEEVDQDPRAAYFRQMENGMYVRMALLASVLRK